MKIKMIGFKCGKPRPIFSRVLTLEIGKYEVYFLRALFKKDWDFISIRKID